MKLGVILGSIRNGRKGEAIFKQTLEVLKKDERFEVVSFDLKDWTLPMFELEFGEEPSEIVAKWRSEMAGMDAYVIVTPEYNHGYSSVLKNALDYLNGELHRKPIAYVSYGGLAGGARAVEQLRLVAIEQQMAPIRDAVLVNEIWEALDEHGHLKDERFTDRLNKVADELYWWGDALLSARKNV